MEADISIWRKTGHFYFALTRSSECVCLRRVKRQPEIIALASS